MKSFYCPSVSLFNCFFAPFFLSSSSSFFFLYETEKESESARGISMQYARLAVTALKREEIETVQ